jgi:predicted Kef-type K+ transport protein
VFAAQPPKSLPSLPVVVQVAAMSLNCMFGAALARSRNIPIFGTILAGVLVGPGGT